MTTIGVVRPEPKGFTRDAQGILRDRWGRYGIKMPDGEWRGMTRVTTLAETLSEGTAIRKWDRRTAVKGMTLSREAWQIAAAVQADPITGKWPSAELERAAEMAFVAAGGERGSNAGTDWHKYLELREAGLPVPDGVPAGFVESFEARARAMAAAGLRTVPGTAEKIVACPELGCAGTLDKILTDGAAYYIGDEKSQQDWYEGGMAAAIQLAIYANSPLVWDPVTETLSEMPPVVSKTLGKIIWAPAGKGYAEIKNVDIAAGWELAKLCYTIRQEYRRGTYVTTAPVAPATDVIAAASTPTPPSSAQIKAAEQVIAAANRGVSVASSVEDAAMAILSSADEAPVGTTVTVGGVEFTKHTSTADAYPLPTAPECSAPACREREGCPDRAGLGTIVEQIEAATGLDDLSWLRSHHIAAGRWASWFDEQGIALARKRGWMQ